MNIKNFENVTKELQNFLVNYLEEQGIDTKQKFKCLNPKHDDGNPSMSLMPGGTRVHCFACSARMDIFDCVAAVEKKSLHGTGFIIDVLQYLAGKYNVTVETTELTEDKMYELSTYRAYKTAAEFITSQPLNKLAEKEVKYRKWSTATLANTITGCVPSFQKFIEHMKSSGYDEIFLSDCDLSRADIFNENNLIFTTCDEFGHPVGFTARNLKYNKENPDTGEKYINQRTTGIKVNIYQKGKRLYGFNLAREEAGPIYIFEGQGDVLTARENKISNCCAIGSTALTTEHIILLKEWNRFNIILCLDGDTAGQDKIEKLLDTRFAGHKEMRVFITLIPDGMDPDDFIRSKGIEAFQSLAKWSAFEWRLNRFDINADPAEISRSMVPYIVNEPSYIAQEDMCRVLSKATGYSVKTISSEVERLQNVQEQRKTSERRLITERALHQAIENPQDAEVILTAAKDQLLQVSRKYDEDHMSEETFLKDIVLQRELQEAKSDKFSGFILGNDLINFQEALSGEWDRDVLMVIGGRENTGKSAICTKLAYEIAIHEKDNDALVIYHTIDDTADQLLPRFVTIAEGSRSLTINHVKDPNYWSKQDPSILFKRKEGYAQLESLVKRGRLVVKDANHGMTLGYMETLINYYMDKYPNRRMVYILDNFHKLADFSEYKDNERVRFKTLSKSIKRLATAYHIPVITTMEYTKLSPGTRPSNHNIAESVAMSYDSNFIGHMYNELHEKGPLAESYHVVIGRDGNLQRLPRIEMIVGKNKISSFKNSLFYDFYPASSDFIAIDESVIANEIQAAKEEKEQKMNKQGRASAGGLYT